LQERVAGTPLHHVLGAPSGLERRNLVAELARVLRIVHATRPPVATYGPACASAAKRAADWAGGALARSTTT
jgi:hypothetical protein